MHAIESKPSFISANAEPNQVQNPSSQIQLELRNTLRNEIGPQRFEQLKPLLDLIDGQGNTQFTAVLGEVQDWLNHNPNDLPTLSKALHYLNAQSMVLDWNQTTTQAELNTIKGELGCGIEAFVKRFGPAPEGTLGALEKLTVAPVFTAHPTNIVKPEVRQLVCSKTPTTGSASANKSEGEPAKKRQKHSEGSSKDTEFVGNLFRNQGRRERAPTVAEEAAGFQKPFEHFLKASHQTHKAADGMLKTLIDQPLNEPLIKAGNWVGGDRDGNYFVTAATLKASVAQYAATALKRYQRTLSDIKLSSSIAPDQSNLRTLASMAQQNDAVAKIQTKLEATRQQCEAFGDERTSASSPPSTAGYTHIDELINDLQELDFSSLPVHLQERARTKIRHFILDIKANGFHGVSTDIRQNSAVNEKTIDILFQLSGLRDDYRQLREHDKQQVLNAVLNSQTESQLADDLDATNPQKREAILKQYSPHEIEDFKREVQLLKTYSDVHTQFGKAALENCITANTETVSDLMEVMVLLRHAGVAGKDFCDMQVVGLIETVDDLKNAPKILDGLLANAWYKGTLSTKGNKQRVMVGYSDSDRMAGSLASRWAVYKGTQTMMEIAKNHGVKLQLFHGRGGTEARGAGEDYWDEISVHDGRSLEDEFRQTEQGEEVFSKFGSVPVANASLNQMLGATLNRVAQGGDQSHLSQFSPVMEELATHAEASYKSLYDHPDLARFFESATPISFVKHLNAGSRPAKRVDPNAVPKALNINELRAIPWVSSWMQIRAMAPAFFGTGTAIQNLLNSNANPSREADSSPGKGQAHTIETLRDMYQSWPFFRNFVDNTESALAKADMEISRHYAGQSPQNQAIMDLLISEFNLTVAMINAVKQQTQLLQHRPQLKNNLEARSHMLQCANAFQLSLFQQSQKSTGTDPALIDALVESTQAVTTGLGRVG